MSKRTLLWLLIISLVINISTLGTFGYYRWIRTGKEKRVESYRRHKDFWNKKLGINEEQSAKMEELRKEFFEELKPLMEEIKAKREELVVLIKQDSISIELVNEKIEQISAIETDIHKKAIANLLKHRAILTKEQTDKLIDMVTNRMFGLEERRPRHGGPDKKDAESKK